MAMTAGKRFFDQYSVICVFGSVVGCVVVPLITQSVETIIFSAILLSITAKTLTWKSGNADSTNKDDGKKTKDSASSVHKGKKKKALAHQPVVSLEERERQRVEDLRRLDEQRQAEKERKLKEKKEKKAKQREERMKKKSTECTKDNMKMQVLFPIGKLDTKRASEYVSESAKTVEEVSRRYHSPAPFRHQRNPAHSRNHSDSLPQKYSHHGNKKYRSHANRLGSDSSVVSPISEALAFNPQPPVQQPSSPKTKAWGNPPLPPEAQTMTWRSSNKVKSSSSTGSSIPYSAPGSFESYQSSDMLTKSLSLEEIATGNSNNEERWTQDSPTESYDSKDSDQYYSLFGSGGNRSPFGVGLLPAGNNIE